MISKFLAFGLLSFAVGVAPAFGDDGDDDANVSDSAAPVVDLGAVVDDIPGEVAEAPKPAENIDLKEVMVEPLKPSDNQVDTPIETVPTSAEPTGSTIPSNNTPAADVVAATPVPTPLVTPDATAPQDRSVADGKEEVSSKTKVGSDDGERALTPAEAPDTEEVEVKPLKKQVKGEVVPNGQNEQPPLVLLNSEVMPGTSTRLGWSPSVSFMGISAPTAVLVLNGVKKGPTLCLTAAVHGDELNGIEIVRRLLYNIDPEELSGAVVGVPIVNLPGFRRSSRYLPDRRDLNRFFPGNPNGSSAARIAYSFYSEVISHCDLLIDLHTGSFRRTNLPQLRADLSYPEVTDFANKMGAIVVVQSQGAQGSLRRAAVEGGIPAITLEAGAPHELQKASVEHGVKSIENAMDSLGMIERRRFWERSAEPVYYQSAWVRSRDGGILFSDVALGDSVREGDILGVVTDPITNMRSEIKAPFDGRVIGMALNQVMFPGFAAYHLGLRSSVEEAAKKVEILEAAETSAVLAPVSSVDSGIESESDAPVSETAIPATSDSVDVIEPQDALAPVEDSE